MFTPADILSTNRRDFKVKTCVGGGKVFAPSSPSQTASAGRDTASKSGRPAEPADDPLPHVAREVKHEVADAVRLFARAPPDLLVREAHKAALDLRQVIAEQVAARLRDEGARDLFAHSPSSGRRLCLAL